MLSFVCTPIGRATHCCLFRPHRLHHLCRSRLVGGAEALSGCLYVYYRRNERRSSRNRHAMTPLGLILASPLEDRFRRPPPDLPPPTELSFVWAARTGSSASSKPRSSPAHLCDRLDAVLAVAVDGDDALVSFVEAPGIAHAQLGAQLARPRLHEHRPDRQRRDEVGVDRAVGRSAVSDDDVRRRRGVGDRLQRRRMRSPSLITGMTSA